MASQVSKSEEASPFLITIGGRQDTGILGLSGDLCDRPFLSLFIQRRERKNKRKCQRMLWKQKSKRYCNIFQYMFYLSYRVVPLGCISLK